MGARLWITPVLKLGLRDYSTLPYGGPTYVTYSGPMAQHYLHGFTTHPIAVRNTFLISKLSDYWLQWVSSLYSDICIHIFTIFLFRTYVQLYGVKLRTNVWLDLRPQLKERSAETTRYDQLQFNITIWNVPQKENLPHDPFSRNVVHWFITTENYYNSTMD